MVTQCVVGVLFHVEAVSLTCYDDDDTTDVCPGTEVTCTCSVESDGLIWKLPLGPIITFDYKDGVGKTINETNGVFVAVLTNNTVIATNNTGRILESMLIYTATKSLVDATVECKEQGTGQASVTINDIFAGWK